MFRVATIISDEPGVPDSVGITEIALESELSDAINILYTKRLQATQSSIVIPSHIADSPYDMIGHSQTESLVASHVLDSISISDYLAYNATTFLKIFGFAETVPFVLAVNFPSGGTGVFELEATINGSTTPKLIEASDSELNNIPLNKKQFSTNGSSSFSSESTLQDYIDAAARFGISISVSGSGGGYTCSSSTTNEGVVIVCKAA